MTSKEIQQIDCVQRTERWWLQEVAYQLALLNESKAAPVPIVAVPETPILKRGPGRPPKEPK